MGKLPPDQQLQVARTMNMYMEEAHAIQEQGTREHYTASNAYDGSASSPLPTVSNRTTSEGLASLGQAFTDLGREVGVMELDDG